VCSSDLEPRTVKQLAAVTKVPEGYLSKVMQSLSRAGLVRSQRGLHGGFTLERDPRELSILEVVNAVDPVNRIETCPLGLPSHGRHLCPMHRRLDDATALVEKAFSESTLAELLGEPGGRRPLCESPRSAAAGRAGAHPSAPRAARPSRPRAARTKRT
jgi:Rrf2 family protein